MELSKDLLELMLPSEIVEYFDCIGIEKTEEIVRLILEEKNKVPPLPKEHKSKPLHSKGFKEIEIDDFPLRGKKVTLLLRRRVWKIEGVTQLHKRDIQLTYPGTRLAKEFAAFLKG